MHGDNYTGVSVGLFACAGHPVDAAVRVVINTDLFHRAFREKCELPHGSFQSFATFSFLPNGN